MRTFTAILGVLLIDLIVSALVSLVAAVPLMWFFAALHEYVSPAVTPIGYGPSVLIALFFGWFYSFLSLNASRGD